MKHFIVPTLLLFLFGSCEQQKEVKKDTAQKIETEDLINKIDTHDLEILEIDNCEYIFYKKSPTTNKGFGFMAHKGNCKNSIHCHNGE